MKEEKISVILLATFIGIVLIALAISLVLSIINVIQKGFKSYGVIVLGAVILLAIVFTISFFTEKRNPKSKFSKFIGNLILDLTEGVMLLLSSA